MNREQLTDLEMMHKLGAFVITPELFSQIQVDAYGQGRIEVRVPITRWPKEIHPSRRWNITRRARRKWIAEVREIANTVRVYIRGLRGGKLTLRFYGYYRGRLTVTPTAAFLAEDSPEKYLDYFRTEIVCRERAHLYGRYVRRMINQTLKESPHE